MPLTGSFTWTERIDSLKIVIPLKGSSPKTVDIFVTSSTLKVNFSPYIVDILLFSAIDSLKHKATIKDGNLQITIYKAATSQGLWGEIELKTENKSVATKLREESRSAQDALEAELGVKRRDRKADDERFSLRKQMSLEEDERNFLDSLKQEEKRSAEEEVYATFASMHHSSAKVTEQIDATVMNVSEAPAPGTIVNKFSLLSSKEPPNNSAHMMSSSTKKEIFEAFDAAIIKEDDDVIDLSDDIAADTAESVQQNKLLENVGCKGTQEGVGVGVREAEDIRYIPPPRVLTNAADSKGK